MNDSQRIVIITQDGLEQRYVANVLCRSFDVAAIVLDASHPTRLLTRVGRYSPVGMVSKSLRAAYLRLVHDRSARTAALRTILGDSSSDFAHPERVARVPGFQSSEAKRVIGACDPDIVAVYGCGIVPDELLNKARLVALNMHTGIAPEYRGTHCTFWPIVNGEPQMLGATVHTCTSRIDHGRVFSRIKADIQPDDGLHEVFARCVQAGADAYAKAIHAALAGETGQPPSPGGRMYRAGDRGIRSEIRARHRLRTGLLRG